jgi:hypothetical protein
MGASSSSVAPIVVDNEAEETTDVGSVSFDVMPPFVDELNGQLQY